MQSQNQSVRERGSRFLTTKFDAWQQWLSSITCWRSTAWPASNTMEIPSRTVQPLIRCRAKLETLPIPIRAVGGAETPTSFKSSSKKKHSYKGCGLPLHPSPWWVLICVWQQDSAPCHVSDRSQLLLGAYTQQGGQRYVVFYLSKLEPQELFLI